MPKDAIRDRLNGLVAEKNLLLKNYQQLSDNYLIGIQTIRIDYEMNILKDLLQ